MQTNIGPGVSRGFIEIQNVDSRPHVFMDRGLYATNGSIELQPGAKTWVPKDVYFRLIRSPYLKSVSAIQAEAEHKRRLDVVETAAETPPDDLIRQKKRGKSDE